MKHFRDSINTILLSFVFAIASTTTYAQIKINNQGKFFVGVEPDGSTYTHDYDNILSGTILGPSTYPWREGAKLAFGDFGKLSSGSWNIFVGERSTWIPSTSQWQNNDSDQLWLQGKKGIFLSTNGNAVNTVAYCTGDVPSDFVFNCNVKAIGFTTISDEKYKSNIQKIGNALGLIKRINGVSYDMLENPFAVNTTITPTGNLSTKEQQQLEKNKTFTNPKIKRYGVTAQNVQKVLPELVKEDSLGLSVNYLGLIPVIIEALKEHDDLITAQSLKIKELQTALGIKNTSNKSNNRAIDESIALPDSIAIHANAYLFQNTPNPFSNETTINYYLPQSANDAHVWVMNLQGTLLKDIKLTAKGNASIFIKAHDLKAGMYYYSLIVDGKEVDSKKMIIGE